MAGPKRRQPDGQEQDIDLDETLLRDLSQALDFERDRGFTDEVDDYRDDFDDQLYDQDDYGDELAMSSDDFDDDLYAAEQEELDALDLDGFEDDEDHQRGRGGVLLVVAGVLFGAIIAGVGAYFYLFRDTGMVAGTDGALPVVVADAEPYRETPEDPGGLQVDNQDRQVFNRLSGDGVTSGSPTTADPAASGSIVSDADTAANEATEAVENLLEEPETPQPVPGAAAQPTETARVPAPQTPAATPTPSAPPATNPTATQTANATTPAPAADPAPASPAQANSTAVPPPRGTTPAPVTTAPEPPAAPSVAAAPSATAVPAPREAAPAAPTAPDTPVAAATTTAVPMPTAKPQPPAGASAPTASAPRLAVGPTNTAPAPAPTQTQSTQAQSTPTQPTQTATAPVAGSGGVQIQLGALGSEAAARSAWQRISSGNSDLMGSLGAQILRHTRDDGVTFYRLRAGPLPTRQAAVTLCGQLQVRGQACFVP